MSFKYAFEGIESFFRHQPNAVIHLLITVLVFLAAVLFHVSGKEWIALILSAGFVWSAEIFNTAIEAAMDHISPDQHPGVKFIKDVSAAAVLVAAITASAAGCIIFIPKI
jgi:diacylglycerol kinase